MTSSEQEFLNNYHPEDYEKPSVAVDLLVFTIEEAALKLVMIRREEMPFQNKLLCRVCLLISGSLWRKRHTGESKRKQD
ncbi:hypothetical protein [Eisenbergiella tayi]|uniref:hypothetical protein n=1 Tax=Eisenbergiella tayi TaxID=1432052 RepID=UPI0004B3E86B|nr:hypothetical protein [Eisenbergiella tayi]